jgi:Xaa-Pro aminopeptidase
VSFPSIIAADANASLPHAVPGKKKIKAGGIVLIDWGAKWGGYCSDLTRVVAVGKMKPKIREIYKIVLDAQVAAIDAIAPGKRLCDIDAVARRAIDKAGYGERFGHSLGHGIGLDIHEQPVLAAKAKGELRPGQVVTVEPGIYLPGVGGVRIEDDVLVTPRGRKVLSDLPKSLESAII